MNGSLKERAGTSKRKPARLPDASLDVLGAIAQVRVARVDLAPRVHDRDHGLARVVRAVEAHL